VANKPDKAEVAIIDNDYYLANKKLYGLCKMALARVHTAL